MCSSPRGGQSPSILAAVGGASNPPKAGFKLISCFHSSHHCLRDQLQRPGQCANTELHGIKDGEDGEGLRGGKLHSCQGHRDEGGEAGHDGDGGGHGRAH